MKLVIRSANHKQPDFDLQIEDSMKSIRDVKLHLSQNYPEKPDKSFMRMIFQGHLLADERLLTDVFNAAQDSFVVHLVCLPRIKTDDMASTNTNATPNTPSNNNQTRGTPVAVPNRESTAVPNASSIGNVANVAQLDQSTMPRSMPQTFLPDWPQNSGPVRSDIAFTEWYARYYSAWLVYLSTLQAQAMGVPNAEIIRLQSQFTALNAQPVAAAPGVGGNPMEEQVAPPRAPDNRGINAAAGPLFDDDDEDGRARDLLDWVYVAVRAGILLSLIYLYSSIPRIVALIAMLGAVWLLRAAIAGLHNNRAQRQPADRQPQGPAEQQQANAPQHQQPQPQPPENNGDRPPAVANSEPAVTPPAAESLQPPAQAPLPPPVPTYRVVFSAIAGFFLSLFPDAPGLQQHQHID